MGLIISEKMSGTRQIKPDEKRFWLAGVGLHITVLLFHYSHSWGFRQFPNIPLWQVLWVQRRQMFIHACSGVIFMLMLPKALCFYPPKGFHLTLLIPKYQFTTAFQYQILWIFHILPSLVKLKSPTQINTIL